MQETEQKVHDIVIIGAGPAGYSAAIYAARAGLDTVLLEKMTPGGQMANADLIENYPGFPEGIKGFELATQMKENAERFGIKTTMSEVKSVELSDGIKTVSTPKKDYKAKVVIIAAGARPRPLGLDREKELIGKGISYCATCDGMFFRQKEVAVVGGGNTAVSDVRYLAKICKKVYLIHRRNELRAGRESLKALEQLENVELVLESKVKALKGDIRLEAIDVETKSGIREIKVEGLFVAIGNVPNTELFRNVLALDDHGYIVADESLKTNIKGVFAAGDIRTKDLRQVVTAASDGATSIHFAGEILDGQETV